MSAHHQTLRNLAFNLDSAANDAHGMARAYSYESKFEAAMHYTIRAETLREVADCITAALTEENAQ